MRRIYKFWHFPCLPFNHEGQAFLRLYPILFGWFLLHGANQSLETRLKEHNAGRGAPDTSARLPIQLVYKEQFRARWQAERRELQLKNWSRQKKKALISRDLERLKELSKSRDWRSSAFPLYPC